MLNSKFISIYINLSKSERIMLRKFFDSPYHNNRNDVVKLIDYLYSKKKLTENTINNEAIYKYVYPDKKYDYLDYRHLLSFATKVIEDFLVHHHIKSTSLLNKKIILAKKYRQLNLYKQSRHVLEIEIPKIETIKDSTYYFYQTEIEQEKYLDTNPNNRKTDSNLKKIADKQLDYFIIETLKSGVNAYLHQQIKAENNAIHLLNPIIDLIRKNEFQLNPLAQFYYTAYCMLTEKDNEIYFKKIVAILLNKKNLIPENEVKNILLLTINYCIKKINSGEKSFALTSFSLYIYGIENKILFESGELSRFTFTNTITIGIQLNKIKEMKLFINNFKKYLSEEEKDRTVKFNNIRLDYAEKKYKDAMLGILTTDFNDIFWNLSSKFTLIKIYYEQKETEVLEQYLNSFRIFLYRQKKIGYHKKRYQNIIKFIKMMTEDTPLSKTQKATILSKINNYSDLPDKDWFIMQLK